VPSHPPISPNATDSELLLRLQDKDEYAYKILFDRYHADLFRQATYKLNGDTDAAEEVVAQVFVAFWVEEKYKVVKDNLKGYLARMMHFKAVSYIRDNARRRDKLEQYRDEVILGHTARMDIEVNDVEAHQAAREADQMMAALQAEIAALPEQCRKVFTEVYLHEKKYKQVAEEFGISVNTVKDYMRVAMGKLRSRMAGLPVLPVLAIMALGLLLKLTNSAFFVFLPTLIHQLNDC
jgi:RNA polymerase sigma factor (sigma-70 family)